MKHNISDFTDINPNKDLAFSNIPRSETQFLTHGYHRYPAKFIPSLADYLLEENTRKGDLICDPFGGCGTSLVEAKIKGRNSIGIDINPIAGLITQVKITPISPNKLNNIYNRLDSLINASFINSSLDLDNERLNYWFTAGNIEKLSVIYSSILSIKDRKVRMFFMCAFSNILKNSSKWLMKSVKPTIDKEKVERDPNVEFNRHLDFMLKKNLEFNEELKKTNNFKTWAKFYLRDARHTKLKDKSIDYILTSPPYVTSYEYADLHQLSLIWLEAMKQKEWVGFKRKFIGTSHRKNKHKDIYSSTGDRIVDELMYNDAVLSGSVRTYFQDMADFIKEGKRILKKGKKMTLVIGNTSLKNVDILNAEVAYEQMHRYGLKNIKVEKRETSFASITPFRDSKTGKFTSIKNPNKKRAYQFEYIITGAS